MDYLGQISQEAARRFGDKTALICEDKQFTFTEIDALSCQLANGLAAKGVEPGDRVTIYSQNCWEWLVAYHGAAKTGAVLNPINVMLTPEEVGYVANDCGAKVIMAGGDKGGALMDIKGSTPLEHVVTFGGQTAPGALAFDDLLAGGKTTFAAAPRSPDELSTICYTSGTTGHPKGAMQSHKAVMMNAMLTAVMHRRTGDDTVVSALPCAHVYGNVVMNGALFYGMTFVLVPRFDETAVLDAIQENRATMYEGVPTSYMMMLTHPKLDDYDLSSLSRMTVGGQTMPVAKEEEVEARFGAPLLELWGMTELAGLGTTHAWYAQNRLGSIGVSLPYIECRVADVDDAAKTLPAGDVGELMVRGPLVMQGYFGNEKATAETIEPDGWLHTGDLVSRDEDGYYFVVDRRKDMILTGGYNIYPAEIERVLAGHPAVAMSAVGRQADDLKGETAKAYIVLKPGATGDADEVVNFCREHLAAYKVPRAVQFVDALPTTSTGKIMRRELSTLDP
jgi:long-chain acyl-CoA synthetase